MRWPKILCLAFVFAFSVAKAQSPTPIVVQAVLAKQKAALEKLDELQEAADQLRIFSKRG